MNQDSQNDQTNAPTASSPTAPDTPQPISSYDQPPIVGTTPKKNHTALIVIAAAVLLLVAGALAYALTKDASKPTADTNTNTSSTTSEETSLTPAQQTIGAIEAVISAELRQTVESDEYGGVDEDGRVTYGNAAYQSGTQEFAVYPSVSYGVSTTGTEALAADDMAKVTAYFTENNFAETQTDSGVYASSTVVCALSLLTKITRGHDGISLGCADIEQYAKSYADIEPFYLAYRASEPEAADNLQLSAPTIKDGVDGYKNASLSISSFLPDSVGGFAGLFYFTPSTDSWNYFLGTQSDLLCEKFSSDDLKKAFSEEKCGTSVDDTELIFVKDI